MAYADKVDSLSPDHVWDFSANLNDSAGTLHGTGAGSQSYDAVPILQDGSNSLTFNSTAAQAELATHSSMNSAANDICVRAGWIYFTENVYTNRTVYVEGGFENNIAVILSIDNLLHVQTEASIASPVWTEIIGVTLLEKNRPYHLCIVLDTSGVNDRFEVFVDGVSFFLSALGGDDMPIHLGKVTWGYPDLDIKVGSTTVRPGAEVDLYYRKWASWSLTVPTDDEIREIMFENDALPSDVISSDTEANMQTAMDALDNDTRVNEVLAIQIEANTGDTSFELDVANLVFDDNTSIQVQYLGTATLTLNPSGTTNFDLAKLSVPNGGTITIPQTATITLSNLQSGDTYYVYDNTNLVLLEEGTTTGTSEEITTILPDATEILIRCGRDSKKRFETTASVLSGAASAFVTFGTDSARSANDATALAYSGISINGGTEAVSVTGARTVQEFYDYQKAWANSEANLQYTTPADSADGIAINQTSGWDITITGGSASLSATDKSIDGTKTVASGGFYEDSTGAKWELSGAIYYAKHVWRNVKDLDTNSNQQDALVFAYDTDNDILASYSTGLTAGALTSDASGNVEGYYVYQKDAVTYSLTQYIGLYGFDWLAIPIASTGAQIGITGSPITNRLVTDAYVTLSKSAALAVSGVTATHGVDELDFSAETHSDVQDNIKARQAATADIEAGKPGYQSYYEEGALLTYDGSVYNLNADWTAQNIADTTETLKGGTVELGTAGDIDFNFNGLTIDYTAGSGTFDHRNEVMNGTITLVNSGGGSLTVQVDPTVTYVNTGPNITVDASVAVVATINSVDGDGVAQNFATGTRVQLYNSSGAAASAWAATTAYTIGDKILRSTGAGTEDGAGGTAAGLWYECTTAGTTSGSEPTWSVTEGATTSDGSVVWTTRVLEMYNAAPGAVDTFNVNYTYLAAATIRWRCVSIDTVTATTWMTGTFSIGSSGGSASVAQVSNEVYDLNALDGSTITEFAIDGANVEVDITDADNVTTVQRGYNWFQYYLSTEAGIRDFLDYFTAVDANNYVFTGTLTVENTKGTALRITGGVIKRSDGASIVNDAGGSIIIEPARVYNIETGVSGLTASESNVLLGLPSAASVADAVWDEAAADHVASGSTGESLSNATAPTAAAIADAVWDEDIVAAHTTSDSAGEVLVAAEAAAVSAAALSVPTAAAVADAVWDEDITTHTATDSAGEAVAATPAAAPTAAAVADAVWDEAAADHVATGSMGATLGGLFVKIRNFIAAQF